MIKEVLNVITSPIFLLITVGVITLTAAVILMIIELKFKFEFKKKKKNQIIYIIDLERVSKSKKQTSKKMFEIDRVAKKFFHDIYGTKENANYAELSKYFKKIRDEEAQRFCERMLKIYYTQQRFTDNKVKSVISEISELIKQKRYLLIKKE